RRRTGSTTGGRAIFRPVSFPRMCSSVSTKPTARIFAGATVARSPPAPATGAAQNGKTFQNYPLPDRLLSRAVIALVLTRRGLHASIYSSRIVYNGQACAPGLLFWVIALAEPPQMLLAN